MALDSGVSAPDPLAHTPVLVDAVMEWLRVREGGVYVDCTAGAGGHAARIACAVGGGRLVALDRDPRSVEMVRQRLAGFPDVTVLHRNYGELASVLGELGIEQVDGILLDVGMSSMQLDDPVRGFSFQEDGPLDMRLDPSSGATARDYLAGVSERDLARVLKLYGDVGPARRVAAAIVRRRTGGGGKNERNGKYGKDAELGLGVPRKAGGLETTVDLVEAVCEGLDFVSGPPDELRTVFQAVRIAVNEEFRWLEAGLRQAIEALAAGGRLVVISFHSGEDRIVKNVLREAGRARRDLFPDGRLREVWPPRVRVLTRKPVQPDVDEMRMNPRSRSARLRAAEGIRN